MVEGGAAGDGDGEKLRCITCKAGGSRAVSARSGKSVAASTGSYSVPMPSTFPEAVVRAESVMVPTVVPPIVSVLMAMLAEPVARAADGTLKQAEGGHRVDPLGLRIKAWPQPPPFPPPNRTHNQLTFDDANRL